MSCNFQKMTTSALPTKGLSEVGIGGTFVPNNTKGDTSAKGMATSKVGFTGDDVANNSRGDLSALNKATSKVGFTGDYAGK